MATNAELETRIRALKEEIAKLKDRLQQLELDFDEVIGDIQVARGETIPVRKALEDMRRKYNIPNK